MASKSGSDKQRSKANKASQGSDRLPFEPAKARKKSEKQAKVSSASKAGDKTVAANPSKGERRSAQSNQSRSRSRQDSAIPEEISRRMVKRMTLFCGVPTALGALSFVASYLIVSQELIELPPIAVLLVSLGFFGLGVIGLSYGALSTSWDEGPDEGSLLGWDEFRVNLGRMQQAWKESRNQSQS